MDRQRLALFGGAAGLGAGLMYLLDPVGGRRRRALARDKATHAYRTGSDAMRKSTRDLGNRSKGLVASTGSLLRRENGAPDQVLAQRVRSKMGRWTSHPGALEVEAHDGHVILRGDILASEADRLLRKVEKVKGVENVESQLQMYESAEGVSSLQNGRENRRSLPPAAKLVAGTAGGALAVTGLMKALRRRA